MMSALDRFSLKSIVFTLLIYTSSLFASGWFTIYENISWSKINGATKDNNSLNTLYAVGAEGAYYFTYQGGYDWDALSTGTTENLLAIATAKDWQNNNIVNHVAVGENGTVLHYNGIQDSWEQISGLGLGHFRSAYFDDNSRTFWIGGDNSQLQVSLDYGITWQAKYLDQGFSVLDITTSYDGVLLLAEKNDTTFVLRENESGFFTSHPGDSLADISLIAAAEPEGEYSGTLYLLGLHKGTLHTQVYELPYWGASTVQHVFSADLGSVTDLAVWGNDGLIFWITTEGGNVWESRGTADNWTLIYNDPEGRELGPILSSDWEEDSGRIFGSGGLILKYGFELQYFWPEVNRNISADFNQIEMDFSLIPDLNSVEQGIWIDSDQRGSILFKAGYNPGDSSTMLLELKSAFGTAQIPGEILNVTFSDSLKVLNFEGNYNFREMNYDLTVVSDRQSSFQFNDYYQSIPLGKTTTNWVNGFLNQDDILDFLTFADDTLYCFLGDLQGTYEQMTKIPFPDLINVRVPSAEQLILKDLNQDGLIDLILYDESKIFFLKNESTPSDIVFSGPTAQQQEEAINKLVVYNANNNSQPDLMILGTRFVTLFDITLDSFGTNSNTHESGFVAHLCVEVADINGDGQPDMVLIDIDGQLVLREGYGNGSFNDYNQVYPSSSRGYTAIKVANLNDDHRLEVLAYNSTYIDLIVPTDESNWSFRLEQENIISTLPDLLVDLYIQDFGGSRDGAYHIRPDVIAITPVNLLIFENVTIDQQNINFKPLPSYSKSVEKSFDRLIAGDYDQDGTLDLTAYDLASGRFDIWNKFTWKPEILNYEVEKYQVSLDWTAFPDEAGTINYYNVYRSESSEWDQHGYIRQSVSNHFDDHDMGPYETFWYAVQAVYNGDIESDWSAPVFVQTFYELNGPQSGVLDDTSRSYLAKTSISVEAGNTLEIRSGVRIGFELDTRFDVYGGLIVAGDNVNHQMVDFESAYWDSSAWDGIHLHPAADTVRFNWFSIIGAKTGLQTDNRPLKIKFGGIIGNDIGVLANGDTLNLENVVFDSNGVALRVQGTTHANVKNVTISHSLVNSIVATDASMTGVRNAIIWDNQGPITKEQAGTFLNVKYSTVDSLANSVTFNHINRLAPLFTLSDSIIFQPNIMSPTVDAGDPSDAFELEPLPNGGRINQGLYGGSALATPSFQPRIAIEPSSLSMVVRPGYSDTSGFWIKNPGGSPLDIMSISKTSESTAFQIIDNTIASLAPNDSIRIRLVFSPIETINYLDTLHIQCNDPHLTQGIKTVPLFGKGSDIVPVVRLNPLPEANLRESAVRFWYSVSDSGSQSVVPSPSGTYKVHYVLMHLLGDTVEAGVRFNEEPIDFFPLDDGIYRFKIWANPEPGKEADEVHAKTQNFSVRVKTRTSFPFRWYMVSLPRGYPVDWKWFELGDSSAYLLKWDNDEEEYFPLNTRQIEPGQAFWAFPFKSLELDLALTDNANPLDKNAFAPPFYMERGWNQVGIPSDFSLFWNEMRIVSESNINTQLTFNEAVEAQMIDGVVYQFIQNSDYTGYDWNVVDSTTLAEPWAGYWLKAYEPCSILFPEVPAFDPKYGSVISEPVASLQKNASNGNWQINISLKNAHYTDGKNILGIGSGQTNPVAEPPHIGDYCALYIPSEKGNLTQSIFPFFSDQNDLKVWDLKSDTRNTSEQHTLSWKSSDLLESDIFLYLVDLQSEEVINMRESNNYTFNPKSNTNLFRVYASQDENFRPEIVPLTFKLEQNFPNPFNPKTTIRFGIPISAEGKKAHITIYDVLGKTISVLYSGHLNKGYHQISWDGRNALGKQVASGVYFYRLQAGKTRLMKKMVLVR